MATAYAYFVLMPSTLVRVSMNSVNSNHIGSQCLSVGYDIPLLLDVLDFLTILIMLIN